VIERWIAESTIIDRKRTNGAKAERTSIRKIGSIKDVTVNQSVEW